MSKKIRTEAVDYLFDAILSLKDKEECYTFFEDICTINELLSLSQRFEVAKMLREQKTYLEIAEKTGASTATISRVNRSLNYGNDGYDMVFETDGKIKDVKEIKMPGQYSRVFYSYGKNLRWKTYRLVFNHHFFYVYVKTQAADKCQNLKSIFAGIRNLGKCLSGSLPGRRNIFFERFKLAFAHGADLLVHICKAGSILVRILTKAGICHRL